MPGMMSHQGLGQQLVHPAPGGGAQMQGQWRQPLAGQQASPTEVEWVHKPATQVDTKFQNIGLEMYSLKSNKVDIYKDIKTTSKSHIARKVMGD